MAARIGFTLPRGLRTCDLLAAAGYSQDQRRTLRGRLEIRPLGQETTTRHLGTTWRAHFDFELALRIIIETIDHCGPISDFPHGT